jgi:hypothetical protein
MKKQSATGAHHDLSRPAESISAPTEKSFGVTFAVVFTLLAAWSAYRSGIGTWTVVMAGVAVTFLALAYTMPAVLGPLNWLWFRFGLAIHAVVSPVILGLLFFAVVTPVGVVMRLLAKDLLGLKRSAGTYWIDRHPEASSSMINQF